MNFHIRQPVKSLARLSGGWLKGWPTHTHDEDGTQSTSCPSSAGAATRLTAGEDGGSQQNGDVDDDDDANES